MIDSYLVGLEPLHRTHTIAAEEFVFLHAFVFIPFHRVEVSESDMKKSRRLRYV